MLVPSLVRDVLLEVAERGIYRPLWSSQILDELSRTVRTLLSKRGHDDTTIETYVSRLVNQMQLRSRTRRWKTGSLWLPLSSCPTSTIAMWSPRRCEAGPMSLSLTT